MTKNDYFYSFMDKCGKKLGEKRFKRFKLELIDVFKKSGRSTLTLKTLMQ